MPTWRWTFRKATLKKIKKELEGLRGEIPVSELCRRESIQPTVFYRWSKAFLEAGKNGLTRDTRRDVTTDEVRRLREENSHLKRALTSPKQYRECWFFSLCGICPQCVNMFLTERSHVQDESRRFGAGQEVARGGVWGERQYRAFEADRRVREELEHVWRDG